MKHKYIRYILAVIIVIVGIAVTFFLGAFFAGVDLFERTEGGQTVENALANPVFRDVSVHDPAIIRAGEYFYVFGSHLASAKSRDLRNWTQISTRVAEGNPLIPNVKNELSEVFEWAQTDTLWAPVVVQLEDGRFYMYYCACKGDSPRSAMGIAVSDNIEGPFEDLGLILKSGMWGLPSEDGDIYDANFHPNVVDPDVFFCRENRLWMVYGSYSGGIFIMELDPSSGFPFSDQGYGKHLVGGYHARIEGTHILFNPDTEYYYLFLSFGGLDSHGGYNIRVARSKNPYGPFMDSMGNEMSEAKGLPGTLFHDPSIEPFGTKLMGNYRFLISEGEPGMLSVGYVSPGHSSAYLDRDTGKYYLFFHTRFLGGGETHQLRVHQMFFNEEGWPIIAPYRYSGEVLEEFSYKNVIGDWKVIDHGRDISTRIKNSQKVSFNEDGTLTGEMSGEWEFSGDNSLVLTIDDKTLNGVLLRQFDTNNGQWTMTFSVLSSETGVAFWGSKVIAGENTNR